MAYYFVRRFWHPAYCQIWHQLYCQFWQAKNLQFLKRCALAMREHTRQCALARGIVTRKGGDREAAPGEA